MTSHGAATTATGITFLSSGAATGLAGPMAAPLQINICDTRGATYARDIEVNVDGTRGHLAKPRRCRGRRDAARLPLAQQVS